jgi:DNA-(apurinic or apyrimidinic site) lyase (EC 4.2.99.18)/Formamidopyrimidine-DNA glycosylase (EC 3.2.2.23)
MLRAVPELPEVETIRRGIAPRLIDRRLQTVALRQPRLRWPVPPDLAERFGGRTVTAVDRRGKYLILDFAGERLLMHLGMSGRLFVLDHAPPPAGRHDHLDLGFSEEIWLRLHDPRRFGAVLAWPADQAMHPLLATLGPEPLSDAFDGAHLHRASRGRRCAVKTWLMDGRLVVGSATSTPRNRCTAPAFDQPAPPAG